MVGSHPFFLTNMSTTPFRLITPAKASDYALVLPGISPASRKLAEDLLLKNHREHNIFFNEKGFHKYVSRPRKSFWLCNHSSSFVL